MREPNLSDEMAHDIAAGVYRLLHNERAGIDYCVVPEDELDEMGDWTGAGNQEFSIAIFRNGNVEDGIAEYITISNETYNALLTDPNVQRSAKLQGFADDFGNMEV